MHTPHQFSAKNPTLELFFFPPKINIPVLWPVNSHFSTWLVHSLPAPTSIPGISSALQLFLPVPWVTVFFQASVPLPFVLPRMMAFSPWNLPFSSPVPSAQVLLLEALSGPVNIYIGCPQLPFCALTKIQARDIAHLPMLLSRLSLSFQVINQSTNRNQSSLTQTLYLEWSYASLSVLPFFALSFLLFLYLSTHF